MHLASLLNKAAAVSSLREAIIRHLCTLTNLISSALSLRHYNSKNINHIKNATNLHTKLYSNVHYMTGMTFALVMNSISFSAKYEVAPLEYEWENKADCFLIDI